jgi:glycosyltransferase involved in cell wall biosynthesis
VTRLDVLFTLGSLAMGGSERKTVWLCNSLKARGLHVGIAVLDAGLDLAPQLVGDIEIWQLQRRARFSVGAAQRLRRIIRERSPRTLVAVNQYPALYAWFACRNTERPPRLVGTINITHFVRWRDRVWLLLYRQILQRFDTIVFGCRNQATQWLPAGSGAVQRARVIYNGVDTHHFSRPTATPAAAGLRGTLKLSPDSFVIGTVGRLAPDKNQMALLDGLVQLRRNGVPAQLLLVGDGPSRAALETAARSRQLQDCVHFTGQLADVRGALTAIDLFALPSVEVFSNAALEAMAMSLPVILTRQGGSPEMVTEGVEGHLVDSIDFAHQFAAVATVLWQDPARRAQMGKAARSTVEQRFTQGGMIESFIEVLDLKTRAAT